uniref:Uncharacterized protein n=1 Tax=Ixodes ricinus TaxID=34613 RepID=A0A6B0U9T3_IXORI
MFPGFCAASACRFLRRVWASRARRCFRSSVSFALPCPLSSGIRCLTLLSLFTGFPVEQWFPLRDVASPSPLSFSTLLLPTRRASLSTVLPTEGRHQLIHLM